MRTLLVALLLLPLAQAQAQTGTPARDAQAGQTLWEGPNTLCKNCHGVKGEGGFGPDLAGQQYGVAGFTRAVRKPWGIMPAFTEEQITDQEIAAMIAYFGSLAKVQEPGQWRIPVPPGAPKELVLTASTVGCGQCHGLGMSVARDTFAFATDFEWFKKMTYEHTMAMPEQWASTGDTPGLVRMGNYSRARLPESLLQEIWGYASADLGFRLLIIPRLSAGMATEHGVTYTLTVENRGMVDKGLPAVAAEDVTIALALPSGSTVANTSGAGYQGVRRDAQTHLLRPELFRENTDFAIWQVPRIALKDKQTYTITLSGSGAAAAIPGGTVRWSKPARKDGTSDFTNVGLPRPPPRTR